MPPYASQSRPQTDFSTESLDAFLQHILTLLVRHKACPRGHGADGQGIGVRPVSHGDHAQTLERDENGRAGTQKREALIPLAS